MGGRGLVHVEHLPARGVASLKGRAVPGCDPFFPVSVSGQEGVIDFAIDLVRLVRLGRFSGMVREERLFGFRRLRRDNLLRNGRDNLYGLWRLYGLRRLVSLLLEKGAP